MRRRRGRDPDTFVVECDVGGLVSYCEPERIVADQVRGVTLAFRTRERRERQRGPGRRRRPVQGGNEPGLCPGRPVVRWWAWISRRPWGCGQTTTRSRRRA